MHCRLKSKHTNITIISYFISTVYVTSYGTRVRHTTLQNVLRVASTILYLRYCFIDSRNWQRDATTDDQKQKLVQSVLPTVSNKLNARDSNQRQIVPNLGKATCRTPGIIIIIIITIIIFNYALQPLRLIVRSGLDVPTFDTRRLHTCHHARAPSGGRWNCGREMSGNFV